MVLWGEAGFRGRVYVKGVRDSFRNIVMGGKVHPRVLPRARMRGAAPRIIFQPPRFRTID